MKLNISNLFQFITYISPFILIFTFILIGFLNNEPVNSIIYIGAVCFATFLASLLQPQFKVEAYKDRNALCDLWDLPFIGNTFNTPSLSTFFITFSSVYMILPMILSGSINYGVIILFATLIVADIVSKLSNRCTTAVGAGLGVILGGLSSTLLTLLMYNTSPELMFFTEGRSNNTVCGKPSKKKFKCSVYKNGQLLKEL